MKKKMEFSKWLMVAAGAINLAVITFSAVMIWRTNDLSPLSYLVPSVAAEFSAATVAYYGKARVENRIKLMKAYNVEPTESAFSENF